MARDAQLSGDRVQSEYYLQFADHYYRMLGEGRAKYDEQRRQRGDESSEDDGDDDLMMDDGGEQQQQQQPEREPREDRDNRERRPRRDNRNNGARPESDNDDEERIALEVLPPSIGVSDGGSDDGAEVIEAKPRRRTRRPRPEDEGDIAPAA